MKRYLVFGGEAYYASGGAYDEAVASPETWSKVLSEKEINQYINLKFDVNVGQDTTICGLKVVYDKRVPPGVLFVRPSI